MSGKAKTSFFSFWANKEVRLIIAIGACYRLLMFALYQHATFFPDSRAFWDLASLIGRFNLEGYQGYRSHGYPLMLCFGFGSMVLVACYQFVLGIATSVLMYQTLLNFKFSKKSGFWITLLFNSLLHVFIYETAILTETLSFFLIAIVFWMISGGYLEKNNRHAAIFMGLVLGFLVLVKPFYIYLPFMVYGFSVLKNFSFRKILQQKIIIVVFPMVAYFGLSYVNKTNTGHFVSTTLFGLNAAQNCVYFAEKGPSEYQWLIDPYVKHRNIAIAKGKGVPMSIWNAYGAHEYDYKNLSFPDLSAEMGTFAKQTIAKNQIDYWKQVICRSWLDFWKPFGLDDFGPYVQFPNPTVDLMMHYIWQGQKIILVVFKFAFLLLVPFYLFRFFRNRIVSQELVIVSVIFAASVLQGMVTYGTNAKYSFPFEYLMVIVVLLFVKNHLLKKRFAHGK